MNREIKFRAWNGHNMVDLKQTTQFAIMPDLKIDGLFIPFTDGLKLMQFTGLKDKNGKEIYEGDILTCDGYKVVIEFHGGQFVGINTDKDSSIRETQNRNWLSWEVIGNIYENKDLLIG